MTAAEAGAKAEAQVKQKEREHLLNSLKGHTTTQLVGARSTDDKLTEQVFKVLTCGFETGGIRVCQGEPFTPVRKTPRFLHPARDLQGKAIKTRQNCTIL